ncbi:MAG: 4Fe-4S cluster-binding domain-containing protein [Lentisphaeria bacterium]|nr:MAG: 4Fe-4S cluster-binding domain-containing protein [Lentisphaeria bacterium]
MDCYHEVLSFRPGRHGTPRPCCAGGDGRRGGPFPVYVNEYYLGLIDPADWKNDPISRQALPDVAELADRSSSFDPLAEEEQMPVPRLIHRFEDRVVLLATGRCAMRCRFCFRKREWADGAELADISESELAAAAHYLAGHPEIHEVLISGGDPLMLPFPG